MLQLVVFNNFGHVSAKFDCRRSPVAIVFELGELGISHWDLQVA